jgi:hypothetical protein
MAWDHAWPMLNHFGIYDNYNGTCHSSMGYLTCGQAGTSVYGWSSGVQINYVRTIDLGPDLLSYCNMFNPKLLIDLTQAAFTNFAPLSAGWTPVTVWQP